MPAPLPRTKLAPTSKKPIASEVALASLCLRIFSRKREGAPSLSLRFLERQGGEFDLLLDLIPRRDPKEAWRLFRQHSDVLRLRDRVR